MTAPTDIAGAAGQIVRTVTGVIPGASEANAVLDAVTSARRWISDRHNWTRVAWFISGGALVGLGVLVLVRKPATAALDASGLSPGNVVSTVKGAVSRGAIK